MEATTVQSVSKHRNSTVRVIVNLIIGAEVELRRKLKSLKIRCHDRLPFTWRTSVLKTVGNVLINVLPREDQVDRPNFTINTLNPELNPICYLLALLGAHHFLHVSRIRVKLLTFRLLMSYIY